MIFRRETNAVEEWLAMNDDGSFTYHVERSGWPMMRGGLQPVDQRMTAEEARERWPSCAGAIDAALAARR
jgi:hypothetical protein